MGVHVYIYKKHIINFWNMKNARSGLYIDIDLQVSAKRLKLGLVCWRRRWGGNNLPFKNSLLKSHIKAKQIGFICKIYFTSCNSMVTFHGLMAGITEFTFLAPSSLPAVTLSGYIVSQLKKLLWIWGQGAAVCCDLE